MQPGTAQKLGLELLNLAEKQRVKAKVASASLAKSGKPEA
jgi:hypothetical protein